jgi:hypothetical protein
MCLSENDPELNRPKLQKDNGVSVKINKDISNKEPDLYTELIKLKELLDKGIITQEEFTQQKSKLLNQ